MPAGLTALLPGSSLPSTSPRCGLQQQPTQQYAALPRGCPALRAQQTPFVAGRQQLGHAAQRPDYAAAHRRRRAPAAAALDVAVTGSDDSSGGAEASSAAIAAPGSSSDGGSLEQLARGLWDWLCNIKPPKTLWRSIAALVLGGEALVRILQGKIHWKNTIEQLDMVGPRSLGVCLLTAAFVGMVFTIQFIREFARLGLTRSVGGVLALALGRELTPVVTSIILAGRVGSAFAAELGTMQVSEQTDSLRVLGSDPVDYLITPRVMACMIAGPILNVLCFCMGLAASVLLAEAVYDVPCNVILDSAMRAISAWDVITSMIKCWVFGTIIATVSCAWGYTTTGGAKGVGESTTSAVVISLVLIFVFDFALSLLFFGGSGGDALRACM